MLGAGGDAASVGREEASAAMQLMRDVLVYCCVSPRISQDPKGEDEIHPRDIPLADVLFLLKWARREAETEKLRSFRGGAESAGVGDHSEDVRAEAFDAARDRGADGGTGTGLGGGNTAEPSSIRTF